jgi:glycerophosphoryl diester phosphodiesterase
MCLGGWSIRDMEWTQSNLAQLATFVNGIGPAKDYFAGSYASAKAKVDMAHDLGLALHPWTFRADQGVMSQFHSNFETEQMYFYCCLGIDGIFSEFPDRTREAVDIYTNYTTLHSGDLTSPACPIQC